MEILLDMGWFGVLRIGVSDLYYCRGYDCKRTFRWRAPSGHEMLALCEPGWYHGAIEYEMTEFMPQWCKENGLKTALKVYGVGDHGGGPTRRDIERVLDMSTWPLMPKIHFGSMKEFFVKLEAIRDDLPVVEKELNFIFPGCYTFQSRLKRANRHGEDHLYDAEALCAMSMLSGEDCPNPIGFTEAWKRILFNQFHDILPGSCIREAREAALGTAQEAGAYTIANANRAMRDLGNKIDTSLFGIQIDPESTAEGGGVGYNAVKSSRLERYAEVADYLRLPGNTNEEKLESLIDAIEKLKERVGIRKTIRDYGIQEADFLKDLDEMVEQAFDDQCTGANPRYPLLSEIKQMYLNAYYGN